MPHVFISCWSQAEDAKISDIPYNIIEGIFISS
jgi:hypothetical protein